MTAVVSATTKVFGARLGKRATFIGRASVLLRDAVSSYASGQYADALELAYQAALRTAGAYVAASPIARRRRLPTGAWNQLKLVGDDGKAWAETFSSYSRVRARLINGLDSQVDQETVAELIELAGHFLDHVEAMEWGGVKAA